MPIFFDTENRQVEVEFCGGDMVAGTCGPDENSPESVGITESEINGTSGDQVPDEVDTGAPTVILTFHTKESLDSFIDVLMEHRNLKFKD